MSLEDRSRQPSDTLIQRHVEWAAVDPPELTKDNKIHRGNAVRSAHRLLNGLDRLGLQLTKPYKVSGTDFPAGQFRLTVPLTSRLTLEFPHSMPESTSSYYSTYAEMDYNSQPFNLLMHLEPKGSYPYKLKLGMPARIPQGKEVSLDQLPLNFRSVGFNYDFFRNPKHRERISELSERRVDMDMVSGDPRKKSGFFGRQTPNGINALSILHLQNPNPLHLKCYEVELFGQKAEQGMNRFLDNTEEIVPESHWQDDENHYCMTGDKETLTYPLFPIELGRISTLSMEIHDDDKLGDSCKARKLLQGIPISNEGTNQWYATGYLGDGNVSLLFKPEWEEDNTRLVYRQKSKKRISPEEIHKTVIGLNALKTAITERLAT